MLIRRLAAVVFLAATMSACGGIVDPSKNTIDTFSGVVPVGGSGSPHTFSVSKTGEFFVTITALSPDPNIFVGVLLGQQSSGGCATLQLNSLAQLNRQALGGRIDKGNYCVGVVDVGYMTQATSYTLRVSRP